MSGVGRLFAGRLVEDLLHFLSRDGGCAAGTRSVFFNAGDAACDKTIAPAPYQLSRDAELLRDLFVLEALGGE